MEVKLKHHLYTQVFLTLWIISIFMIADNSIPSYRELGISYFGAAMIAATARKAVEGNLNSKA